jgi:hypothetical protein
MEGCPALAPFHAPQPMAFRTLATLTQSQRQFSRLITNQENPFQIGLLFDAEMSDEYIPLSQRSAAQLRAEAEQYRCMAATAPAGIQHSLLRLAARIEALADRREVSGGGSQPG